MKAAPRGFWAIWTTVAVDLIGFGILIPLLPLYADEFGASPAAIGVLFATYSLAQFVFSPIWGRLSDRIGRRPVLLVTIAGSAVGSLLTGLAGALPLLFVARFVDGTSGASIAVARATVADVAQAKDRPRLMGLLGAAFGIGFVVGPALGALASIGGTALPFFVAAGLSVANFVATWLRVPETRKAQTGIGRTPQSLPGSRDSVTVRLIAVTFVVIAGFSAFEATFSLLAGTRFGLSNETIALVFAGVGLLLVGVQGAAIAPLTARYGEYPLMRIGLAVLAAGFVVLSATGSRPGLAGGLILIAGGQAIVTPTLSSSIASSARHGFGLALGWQQSASGAARVVGPLMGGALFGLAIPLPYLVAAALTFLSIGLLATRDGTVHASQTIGKNLSGSRPGARRGRVR